MKNKFQILSILLLLAIGGGLLYAESVWANTDFTGDGRVDLADYSILASSWMTTLSWFPDGMLNRKIAQWQLDLNALDSHFIFDGIVVGNPTWISKKDDPEEVKVGNGAIIMTGDDHIEINASRFPHLYGSLTIEAWIKTDYTEQLQTIISKGSGSWQIGLQAATGAAVFSCPGLSGTGDLIGNVSLADGNWHHLAGVYDCDNEQISLYVDGTIDAQATASGLISESDLSIWIGGNPQTNDEGWHGTLDNICIYNYALTLEQVFNRNTYHVDVENGIDEPEIPDPEWGKGKLKAFKTIQHAIDVAEDGDMILVWPGFYQESIYFMGKAITVRSAADAAILQPDPLDGIAFTFMYGEQSDSILEHFVIINSDIALYLHQSSPTLRYLTVVNNDCGIDSIFNSIPVIEHCIFWNNSSYDIYYNTYPPYLTYSCIQRPFPGQGNIGSDPLFVNPNSSDPNAMDFHLQSEYGRYLSDGLSLQRPLSENWIVDAQTSPCIDAGSPGINPFCETMCNGGRINIGAYGDTLFASKSPWPLPADLDYDGEVFLKDILLFSEQWLFLYDQ